MKFNDEFIKAICLNTFSLLTIRKEFFNAKEKTLFKPDANKKNINLHLYLPSMSQTAF